MIRLALLTGSLLVSFLPVFGQNPQLRDPALLMLEQVMASNEEFSTERMALEVDGEEMVLLRIGFGQSSAINLRALGMDGQILYSGYILQDDIDPIRFMMSDEAVDEIWEFRVDPDGDLAFAASMPGTTYDEVEQGFYLAAFLLLLSVEPHLGSSSEPAVMGDELSEDDIESQVSKCVESIHANMDPVMRQAFDSEAGCRCVLGNIMADGRDLQTYAEADVMREIDRCWPSFYGDGTGMLSACEGLMVATLPPELQGMESAYDIPGFCSCWLEDKGLDFQWFMDMAAGNTFEMGVDLLLCLDVLVADDAMLEDAGVDNLLSLFPSTDMDGEEREDFIAGCAQTMMEDPMGMTPEGVTPARAREYCACFVDRLGGFAGADFNDLMDANSPLIVEVVEPCLVHLGMEQQSWNPAPRIERCYGQVSVPVLRGAGGFKVKVRIGDSEKYVIIDSGASEFFINELWLEELEAAGVVGPGDHRGYETVILADGGTSLVEKVEVPRLNIGECSLVNFTVGVLPEGGMLCGLGLLDAFGSWRIDGKSNMLIIGE